LWTFDGTFNDFSAAFSTSPQNSIEFSTFSIASQGASLSLNASHGQFLLLPSPQFALFQRSWTFEVWVYLVWKGSQADYPIVGQCETSASGQCLHLVIRSQHAFLGFYGWDSQIEQNLNERRWYHLTYAYECPTQKQLIYVDGHLHRTFPTTQCYNGQPSVLIVGYNNISTTVMNDYYSGSGLIDHLLYTARLKSETEILDDAILTTYLPFDDDDLIDEGPLHINGVSFGTLNFTSGRVLRTVQFWNGTQSFVRFSNLMLHGPSGGSNSLPLWIYPQILQNATIIPRSKRSDRKRYRIQSASPHTVLPTVLST
jgi:hypothetical protein